MCVSCESGEFLLHPLDTSSRDAVIFCIPLVAENNIPKGVGDDIILDYENTQTTEEAVASSSSGGGTQ